MVVIGIRAIFFISLFLNINHVFSDSKFGRYPNQTLFELSVIHLNDFHSRFEEITWKSTPCKDPENKSCIGGISRVFTVINDLVKTRPNPIVLNAGDNFQGTIWYNFFRWNVTQYFMNLLPFDAFTLGNHEFDHKIEGLVPFMKAIKAPILVANMDSSLEPSMAGLYRKSTVIYRGGKKIGIIGVILKSTNTIAETGNLTFSDESIAVKLEAKRLKLEENCDIIIALSHCGLEVDKIIAAKAGPHLNIIVSSHSHTLLYHGNNPPGPDKPEGDYPVMIKEKSTGRERPVLIVQASCYTKYLGNLTVFFNEENDIHSWEGNPIFLDSSIKKDETINNLLAPWKSTIDIVGNEVIGETRVLLDQSTCKTGECNLGSFIADAMVAAWFDKAEKENWAYAAVAVINSGNMVAPIVEGNITFSDLITSQPFNNYLDVVELRGDTILEMLEYSIATQWMAEKFTAAHMLQVSGLHVTFNVSQSAGSRVQKVEIRCWKCLLPRYELLDKNSWYRIVIPSYMTRGGDGFDMIPKNMRNYLPGPSDIVNYISYIKMKSPITQKNDGRIIIVE